MGKIDFENLGKGSSSLAYTLTDPRDLFNALPGKIHYLRGPQDQVLAAWHARRNERDLVIKMNTGGGKTLVGLLIARSWLNDGIRPVAYLVPNLFLVSQVEAEAQQLGIEVTDDTNSSEYQQGNAILIGTFQKLFNGRSVFGVGGSLGKPAKTQLSGIVIDDAHACFSQSSAIFKLRIGDEKEEYQELLELFEEELNKQSSPGLLGLKAKRANAIQEIPFWAWQSKQVQVASIIHPISESDELMWSWPLIADMLPVCTAVVTGDAFEIYPPCFPTEALLGFSRAQRRVYLTATLPDDSVLIKHFGAAPASISNPIVPSSAGDIGDRMILLPEEIDPNVTDGEIRDFIVSLAEEQNVVVIVPSYERAKIWEEDAALVLDKENIDVGINELKANPHKGLVVLINRYDGIDLPGDMCHILVVDGLPEVLDASERLMQARMGDSKELLGSQIQRLEQGMGRATRSSEDYAVVLLLGRRLIERMNRPEALNLFSPATQVQLKIGRNDIGRNLSSLDDIRDVVEQCLDRDPKWLSFMKDKLAVVRYSAPVVSCGVERERAAFNAALGRDYKAAAGYQQELVNMLPADSAAKAIQMQRLAKYTNFFSRLRAQKIQKSAHDINKQLLYPENLSCDGEAQEIVRKQAERSLEALKKYSSGGALLRGFDSILKKLDWGVDHEDFEKAMNDLAAHLGFLGQQPDHEMNHGPDNLWEVKLGTYYVIEAKNEVKSDNPIPKKNAAQLSQAMDWFKSNFPGREAVPVLVNPVAEFDSHAAIPQGCRVMNRGKLTALRRALGKFAEDLSENGAYRNVSDVGMLLKLYKLNADSFIKAYTARPKHA
ncbi:DEAD/DEAH box helicase family protein [Actinotignum sanguinis]|uniref:DEAD/DEAH box helicase family protein n=1 Tax=Actinotignum sanguinis TaxID=1445614 RepID=UPI002550EE39|nr:DEAD/DEAH box helicase family protein [Actinotignum sanguinis]MDK7197924.1 DEAD/DEAH box helicase family protein [Actinotignum sanguinis]